MKEEKDLEIEQVETVQTTALLRSARILRRVLEKPSANASVKHSQTSKIIIISA